MNILWSSQRTRSVSASLMTNSPDRKSNTRVAIIEDHRLIANLLAEFIGEQPGFEVVAVGHDGSEAAELCQGAAPDLIVLDISLPGASGLEVIEALQACAPKPKILIYTAHISRPVMEAALRMGVEGMLEKSAPFDCFLPLLARVRDGMPGFGPEASRLVRDIVRVGTRRPELRMNEIAVLRKTLEGLPAKVIAADVGLSVSMVYRIVADIRTRCQVRSPQDLLNLAARHGILIKSEAPPPRESAL